MQVRRSSYYAWKKKQSGKHAMEDERIKHIMQSIFSQSRRTYGSHWLKARLKKAGINTSRRRLSRLMKAEGMVPKQVEKWHP